jgi:hypothetical protein
MHHISKVTLPDGRLLKIEGGDAETTARLLANNYLGQGNILPVENEAPLEVPRMKFEPKQSNGRRSDTPIRNTPVANEGDEAPLELPAMTFRR